MKSRIHPVRIIAASLLPMILLATLPARAQKIETTVDVAKTGAPIHPYTYGMFTELLGNIFDHGLWAEMLSDRKFFYPVDTMIQQEPVNTRRFQNQWVPVGSADAVTMDTSNPFVGKHTPLIRLDRASIPGMKQSGMGLKKGKAYSGYVVLAGEEAQVTVSLAWGENQDQQVSTTFNSLTPAYKKYEFEFTAGEDATDGTLIITGSGNGYFKVGAVSLMPADNLRGFRADLVGLLKALNSGIYRWPGGNMLAGYDWRDGIGDRDKRPAKYDFAWNAVESNDVGSDEFMDLCELLDIDPYFVVNIGFGDAYSAAQWVEYLNGDTSTTAGRWRAENGHPEPYGVEWWGIGNEMYGQWQLGHMSIDHYILKHNYFVEAMKAVDPTIKIIGCGATPFETSTTARHHKYPLPFQLPYEYGSDGDWSGKLLAHTAETMDYLAEHLYPMTDHAFDADSQKFVRVDDPVADQMRRVPNRIKAIAEAWEQYLKMIPELEKEDITFAVDEWTGGGWNSGFLRTLCAAAGLHEIFRHSDLITMGGYTAVSSTVRFDDTNAMYSSVGLLFKLYNEQMGSIPLQITGNSPQKQVKVTVGVDKPAEPSGSDTYPLDVFAAKSQDGRFVSVAIINPTETKQDLNLKFSGARMGKAVKVFEIIPPEVSSRNVPGEAPVIVTNERSVSFNNTIAIEPYGIALYKFQVK